MCVGPPVRQMASPALSGPSVFQELSFKTLALSLHVSEIQSAVIQSWSFLVPLWIQSSDWTLATCQEERGSVFRLSAGGRGPDRSILGGLQTVAAARKAFFFVKPNRASQQARSETWIGQLPVIRTCRAAVCGDVLDQVRVCTPYQRTLFCRCCLC